MADRHDDGGIPAERRSHDEDVRGIGDPDDSEAFEDTEDMDDSEDAEDQEEEGSF